MATSRKRSARKSVDSKSTRRDSASMFTAHLQQIRSNLENCSETTSPERELLENTLRQAVESTKSFSDPAKRLWAICDRLGNQARINRLFFNGSPAKFVSIETHVVHTKPLNRFRSNIQVRLADEVDFDTAETLTNEICVELQRPRPWRILQSNPTLSALAMHDHGTPFWVADPTPSTPAVDNDLTLYPARAGLAPQVAEYVFLRLHCNKGQVPRFADSQGYPYWRPGGKTQPIKECPEGYSGLPEAVVDQVRIANLSSSIVTFDRSI